LRREERKSLILFFESVLNDRFLRRGENNKAGLPGTLRCSFGWEIKRGVRERRELCSTVGWTLTVKRNLKRRSKT